MTERTTPEEDAETTAYYEALEAGHREGLQDSLAVAYTAKLEEEGALLGDPRRCPRHPGVATSSPDGLFDAPCNLCEAEMEAIDLSDPASWVTEAPGTLRPFTHEHAAVSAKPATPPSGLRRTGVFQIETCSCGMERHVWIAPHKVDAGAWQDPNWPFSVSQEEMENGTGFPGTPED